jgi:hypothetical protein
MLILCLEQSLPSFLLAIPLHFISHQNLNLHLKTRYLFMEYESSDLNPMSQACMKILVFLEISHQFHTSSLLPN